MCMLHRMHVALALLGSRKFSGNFRSGCMGAPVHLVMHLQGSGQCSAPRPTAAAAAGMLCMQLE
jgi:hypothetical protein